MQRFCALAPANGSGRNKADLHPSGASNQKAAKSGGDEAGADSNVELEICGNRDDFHSPSLRIGIGFEQSRARVKTMYGLVCKRKKYQVNVPSRNPQKMCPGNPVLIDAEILRTSSSEWKWSQIKPIFPQY
jgi:hypothetical protein